MSPKLMSCLTFLAISLLFLIHPFLVSSQAGDELQPGFNDVIIGVHRAESAGATANEVSDLVGQLNKALELNEAVSQLTGANDAPKREALLSQLNGTLNALQGKAAQVEATASRKTVSNRILGYVSGAIAALLGMVVYALGTIFWRRYRIKRTFQMRVIPK
jgi:predicted PurR-regulated permease PerM